MTCRGIFIRMDISSFFPVSFFNIFGCCIYWNSQNFKMMQSFLSRHYLKNYAKDYLAENRQNLFFFEEWAMFIARHWEYSFAEQLK